jgi:hypothetical protein
MHPLKPYISCAHMVIEISSNEELLVYQHTSDDILQVLPKLPLSAHVEPNMRGIRTNNVQDKIPNK